MAYYRRAVLDILSTVSSNKDVAQRHNLGGRQAQHCEVARVVHAPARSRSCLQSAGLAFWSSNPKQEMKSKAISPPLSRRRSSDP